MWICFLFPLEDSKTVILQDSSYIPGILFSVQACALYLFVL